MKGTKKRVVVHVKLDPAVKDDLQAISDSLGIKTHIIANRVVGWVLSRSPEIRQKILDSEGLESDAKIELAILKTIAKGSR